MAGTPQQLWPITAGWDTNKKKKTRNIKKHSDTRKTTATYNKLLDETRDEYYILHFKQMDLNERGSSQSYETANADL